MEYSTEKNFLDLVSNKKSFLVFSSTKWCPNCKFVDVIFASEDIDTSKIIKIDPEATGTALMLGIDAVPAISKFIEGELAEVIEGIIGTDELTEAIASLGLEQDNETEKEKVDLESNGK